MKCESCGFNASGHCERINFCLVVTSEEAAANRGLNPGEITQYGNSKYSNPVWVGIDYGCNLHSEQPDSYGKCGACSNWSKQYGTCSKVAYRAEWKPYKETVPTAVNFLNSDPFKNWLAFGEEFGCINFGQGEKS